MLLLNEQPNGLRYPLVGGTRQRHFDGINLKPCKVLENAQTPASRVHAVLGGNFSEIIFIAIVLSAFQDRHQSLNS